VVAIALSAAGRLGDFEYRSFSQHGQLGRWCRLRRCGWRRPGGRGGWLMADQFVDHPGRGGVVQPGPEGVRRSLGDDEAEMRPRMDAAARRSGSMLARSLWMLGRIPVGSVNLCDRGDADGRADKERGWTRRGREPPLDQERRRLDQLGRAVARDHDDAVAVSAQRTRWMAPTAGSLRRPAKPWTSGCGSGRAHWSGRRLVWRRHLRCLDPERSAYSRQAARGVPAGRADRRRGGHQGSGPGTGGVNRTGSSQRSYHPHPPLATDLAARHGSAGGRGEHAATDGSPCRSGCG